MNKDCFTFYNVFKFITNKCTYSFALIIFVYKNSI